MLDDRRAIQLALVAGDDGGDGLAPAIVRNPDHHHVLHALEALDHLFHLFGEDLLAAGIDAHRATAEQGEGEPILVDLGPVAGNREATGLALDEGLRALLRILVVADGLEATDTHQAPRPGLALDEFEVCVEELRGVRQLELPRLHRARGGGEADAHADGLRGAEGVGQHHARVVGQQALLGLLAPHHPGRRDHDHAADVVRVAVFLELLGHGLGEGIAHDGDGVDPLGIHRAPQLRRIELLGTLQHDRDTADEPGDHRLEPARAVHQRRADEGAVANGRVLHELAVGLLGLGRGADAAAPEAGEEVALAPHHALGHAGGATGVEEQQLVGAPLGLGRGPIALCGGFVGRGAGDGRDVVLAGLFHDEDAHHLGKIGEQLLEQWGEVLVHHHDLGVRVVEQVAQLFGLVAVVDVDGDQGGLERRVDGFHVGRVVVGVDGDLALVGGAALDHPRREVAGTTFDLAPGEVSVALDQTVFVSADFGDDVEGVGEVAKGHCGTPVRCGPAWDDAEGPAPVADHVRSGSPCDASSLITSAPASAKSLLQ